MSTPLATDAPIQVLMKKLDALATQEASAAAQREQRASLIGSVVLTALVTACVTGCALYLLGWIR